MRVDGPHPEERSAGPRLEGRDARALPALLTMRTERVKISVQRY
jgi:hypothetical protein